MYARVKKSLLLSPDRGGLTALHAAPVFPRHEALLFIVRRLKDRPAKAIKSGPVAEKRHEIVRERAKMIKFAAQRRLCYRRNRVGSCNKEKKNG